MHRRNYVPLGTFPVKCKELKENIESLSKPFSARQLELIFLDKQRPLGSSLLILNAFTTFNSLGSWGPTRNMWLFALSQADLFILISLIVRQGRGEYSYTSHQAETKDDLPRCGELREVWATLVEQTCHSAQFKLTFSSGTFLKAPWNSSSFAKPASVSQAGSYDKYYEFVSEGMEARQAEERCSTMYGGRLATFKSAAEARVAEELLGECLFAHTCWYETRTGSVHRLLGWDFWYSVVSRYGVPK